MRVHAARAECVDPARHHDKFYTAFGFVNLRSGANLPNGSQSVTRFAYGPRTGTAQLTKPELFGQRSAAWQRAQAGLEAKSDYAPVTRWLEFDLPDTFDPAAAAAAVRTPLLDAFNAAWLRSWEQQLHALERAVTRAPAPKEWRVVTLPNWVGQRVTQPWGPAVAEQLNGCTTLDATVPGTTDQLTLAVVPAGLATWLSDNYTVPKTALPHRSSSDQLAGSHHYPGEQQYPVDLLAASLRLWQPKGHGPLAEIGGALDTAKMMFDL